MTQAETYGGAFAFLIEVIDATDTATLSFLAPLKVDMVPGAGVAIL